MPTPGTNEIFENLLENQNAYIRSGETARGNLDTKVTNALRQLVNDDTALSGIDTKVTNAMSQLINDDTALSQIDTKVTNAMSQLDNDDSALTVIKDDVTSALAEFSRLTNREYGYTHEAIVTDDLENDYNLIINGGYQRLYNPPIDWETEYASYYYLDGAVYRLNTSPTWDWDTEYYKKYTPNSGLANVSAVGLLAVLNHGVYTAVPTQPDDWETNYDKYFYLTSEGYIFNTDSTWNPNRSYYSYSGDAVRTQGNRLFINGEESDGYTFRGVNSQNGIEFVKIWYFEKDAALQLLKLNINIIKCSEKAKGANTPVLSNDFYDGIYSIEYDIVPGVKPIGVTRQKNTSISNFPSENISDQAITYESLATTIGQQNRSFVNNSVLRKISFPNLRQIISGGVGNQCFYNLQNLQELNLPNLQRIEDTIADMSVPFNNLPKVVLPKDMEYIGRKALTNIRTLLLYSTQAEFNNDWFGGGSPTRFELVCGVGEWKATINLKVAATSWNETGKFGIPPTGEENNPFYLYNLLYDYGSTWVADEHTITIPSSQYTDEAKEYYKNKNWTLVGA